MELAAEISPLDYGRAVFGIVMISGSIGILVYAKKHAPERYPDFRIPRVIACVFGAGLISLTLTGGIREASKRLEFRDSVRLLTGENQGG